jgi:RNA polymerase sigma factor (sigma-70 family)
MSRLSREEEIDLFRAYRGGSKDAGNRLASSLEPLVSYLCRVVTRSPSIRDNIVGAAWYGVARAMRGFDPERGFRLATYAKSWVFAYVCDAVKKDRLNRVGIISTDTIIARNAVGDPLTLIDILPAGNTQIDDWMNQGEAKERIGRAMRVLNKKEIGVIRMRYLDTPCRSMAEIGEKYGVSRQRVDQIEKKAIRKLRNALAAHNEPGREKP